MADTGYIASLSGQLREIVVACYISGLKHTYRELSSDHTILTSDRMLIHYSCFSRLFTSSILQWIVHHASSNLDRVDFNYTY